MSRVRLVVASLGGIVAVAVATVVLTSGEPQDKPLPGSGVLDGRNLVASKVIGFELLPGTAPTLSFADGRFSADAGGCNDADGGYALRGDRLETLRVTSTLIGCSGAREVQDRWFTDFLDGAQIIGRGNSLELRSGRTHVTFDPTR